MHLYWPFLIFPSVFSNVYLDEMKKSVLYWTNILSWNFIVLAHWKTIYRLACVYYLFFLNAEFLVEKQQIPYFISFGLTRLRIEPTTYLTRDKNANKNWVHTARLTITPQCGLNIYNINYCTRRNKSNLYSSPSHIRNCDK